MKVREEGTKKVRGEERGRPGDKGKGGLEGGRTTEGE